MPYEQENLNELQQELVRLLTEALVTAEDQKRLARDRAIRLNGIRKASDDYDYERARMLVSLLSRGLEKVQQGPAQSPSALVAGLLQVLQDSLEGMACPFAVLEEVRHAYTNGSQHLRDQLYTRYHKSAERIRTPPKPPLPVGFLESFDQAFEEFLKKKSFLEKDWQDPDRQAEARTLASQVKILAEKLGNFTDLMGWIEKERTYAGSRGSSLIRDRDPDGRYDPDLEAEYERASRRSGTVALVLNFLTSEKRKVPVAE